MADFLRTLVVTVGMISTAQLAACAHDDARIGGSTMLGQLHLAAV